MSLSNPRTQSPVQKYFRLRASTGEVAFYSKAEQKEVVVDLPFRFVVLDTLSTVGGFHEASNSGLWANEVRDNKGVLTVRSKNGVLIEGPYNLIKDRLRALGGKFASSVYVAYQDSGQWALGNINFVGASLSEFFDFGKGRSFDVDPGVVVTGFSERKKGRTEYFVPVLDRWTVPPNDLSEASRLDKELQAYLDTSLSRKVEEPEPSFAPAQFSGGNEWDSAAPF